MIVRSFSVPNFEKVADKVLEADAVGFDPVDTVLNLNNILLSDELEKNFGLFEYYDEGIYYGHYFFDTAKGRKAINLAKEMLKALPKFDKKAVAVYGVTPEENKKAIWMSRRLGFTFLYDLQTSVGKMKVCVLGLDNYE